MFLRYAPDVEFRLRLAMPFLRGTGAIRFAGPAQDSQSSSPTLDVSVVPARHQIKSCSVQTNDGPAPRRHPLRRFSNGFRPKPLHKVQIGQVNGRTAGEGVLIRPARHRPSFVSIFIRLGDCEPIPCKSAQGVSR